MSYYFFEKPIPLTLATSPPEFPLDALPTSIREYIDYVAEAVQVHPDMPAALVLSVLAACAQGKAIIRLTPEWTEELNLYISVVAEPGERKSAVFAALTQPMNAYVSDYNSSHALEICSYRNKLARLEARRTALINANADDAEIEDVQKEISYLTDHPCNELRLIAADCTAEAAASVMSANNDKIAILSDEGVFDVMAGLYNNGRANINIYLNAYDGQPISIDRKSSASIKLKRPLVTFGICCQPSVITDFLNDKRFIGKGLAQRFIFCQPPSLCGKRTLTSAPVNNSIKNSYNAVIKKILDMPDSCTELTLSPDAFNVFNDYYNEIEAKIGQQGKYSVNRTFLSKLLGKTARICASLHLCEHNISEPVSEKTMSDAIRISLYFDCQNEMIFSSTADIAVAEYVADRIIAKCREAHCESYRARDLKRFCQKYKAKELEEALLILEEHKYIFFTPDDKKNPNRQQGTYDVNPMLLRKFNSDCQSPVIQSSSI